ncbi:MAG: phosphomethylpyrimidine kinase [Clostridiales bacterium]|nr:phosphomethylpyrimidine kinase [Clostridiales bacterium]
MKTQARLLVVTDVAGVGRCSALVVLPVLALSGDSIALLPTAYFSTHTGGFGPVHRLDMTQDMQGTIAHWQRLGLQFDAVYLSYVANARQLQIIQDALPTLLRKDGTLYVDPVMGDHGRPYAFCGQDLVSAFAQLCKQADVIFPNRTEAALLLGLPLTDGVEPAPPDIRSLRALGAKHVVLSGVARGDELGVMAVSAHQAPYSSFRKRFAGSYPGTGDLLAASLIAALRKGNTLQAACEAALDFLQAALENTARYQSEPRFGLAFEEALPGLNDVLS